jgi:hypothetical protein
MPARDRLRLERLLRYASRGPISNERLSLLPDGRIHYKLKRRCIMWVGISAPTLPLRSNHQ